MYFLGQICHSIKKIYRIFYLSRDFGRRCDPKFALCDIEPN